MRLVRLRLLPLLLLCVSSWPAVAQDFDAAGKHFMAAQEAYGKKHFRHAAVEFRAAWEIAKDPVLLFNIGESFQKGGDSTQSVTSYRAYLEAAPRARDRHEVQRRIAKIEARGSSIPDESAEGDDPVAPIATAAAPVAQPAAAAVTTPAAAPAVEPSAATAADAGVAGVAAPATSVERVKDAVAASPESSPAATAAVAASAQPGADASASMDGGAPADAGDGGTPDGGDAATAIGDGGADGGPAIVYYTPLTPRQKAKWLLVGVTFAALVTGTIFELAAQMRADQISLGLHSVLVTGEPPVYDAARAAEFKTYKDEGMLYSGLGLGVLAGAGALAIATAVIFGIDARPVSSTTNVLPRVTPSVGPGHAGVTAAWSF